MKSMHLVRLALASCLVVLPVACAMPEAEEMAMYEGEFEAPTAEAAQAIANPCFPTHQSFETQGFTTGYTLDTTAPIAPGTFNLVSDAKDCNAGFRGKASGGGKFGCFDGATVPNVNAVCVNVPVSAGTTYRAFVRARSLVKDLPASLQFFVDGAACGSPKSLTWNTNEYAWESLTCDFTGATTGSVSLCVRDLVTYAWGNDFGLDELRVLTHTGEEPIGCQSESCVDRSCDGIGHCMEYDNVQCDEK
ncbi:hypothetical protein [Polyangium spumosum]|uniref:CBM-cenC domain-containing protein n=1 Tax=Polyangium spumosum TaxID=889282 RepID=A0A6N7PTP5_9BACT|nr:hypothetical protein [Polyangium spumosum]MRG95612.1 hypothetical protein [Polyangium spumosum]